MIAEQLRVKIFADGADLKIIETLSNNPLVHGVTTNPSLMRKAGVSDYTQFCQSVLQVVPKLPVSFEIFSDDFAGMERQAYEIASWGTNVYVKIPVTNTKGESTAPLTQKLTKNGVQVNITALFTLSQVTQVVPFIAPNVPSFISVFAGRIADTGVDPLPIMKETLSILADYPHIKLIWASPREVFNVIQAHEIGCDVITITPDLLSKLSILNKNLTEFSLETVQTFYADACAARYQMRCSQTESHFN